MLMVFFVNVVLMVCVLINRVFGILNFGNLYLDLSMDFVVSYNVYKNNMIFVYV